VNSPARGHAPRLLHSADLRQDFHPVKIRQTQIQADQIERPFLHESSIEGSERVETAVRHLALTVSREDFRQNQLRDTRVFYNQGTHP
jgi:hypothetical protein